MVWSIGRGRVELFILKGFDMFVVARHGIGGTETKIEPGMWYFVHM